MSKLWLYCSQCRMSHYFEATPDGRWQCPNCHYVCRAPFRVFQDLVEHYVTQVLIKSLDDLQDVRVTSQPGTDPDSRLAYEVELVFHNGHVTYTRVAKFQLLPTLKFVDITQKTRLWVPAREVPFGAEFYLTNGRGPYEVNDQQSACVGGINLKRMITSASLHPDSFVECSFYYSRGEGFFMGGILMVTDDDLNHWDGVDIDELVNGCKFDGWALCYAFITGEDSVFAPKDEA